MGLARRMRDQESAGPSDQPEPAVPGHDDKYLTTTGPRASRLVKVGEPSTESAIT